MPIVVNRWLNKQRQYGGQRAGRALVAWLNDRQSGENWLSRSRSFSQKSVEELLLDAQIVYECLTKYRNEDEFYAAVKNKEVPGRYWDCRERLNKTLSTFTHAPRIEPNEFYEGNAVTWSLTEDSSVALFGLQIDLVLE